MFDDVNGSWGKLELGFVVRRSSSSFLAVMRMRVSGIVQLPLRYSRIGEEDEEVVVTTLDCLCCC